MVIKSASKTGTILLAGVAIGAAAWYFSRAERGRNTLTQVSGSIKSLSESAINRVADLLPALKAKVNNYYL